MIRLVIETATAACSAALLDGGTLLGERHELVGRGHAERLVPMIAELLPDGARPGAILVDCGPGSFTGVRVGLSAARGLAIGWGVPARGFSSLALVAASVFAQRYAENSQTSVHFELVEKHGHGSRQARTERELDGRLAVAIPGGHGELFVQSFGRDLSAGPLRSLRPEDAAATVDEPLIAGAAAAELVALRGHGEAVDAMPRAADARLLPDALADLPPSPIYGRAPDAKPPA